MFSEHMAFLTGDAHEPTTFRSRERAVTHACDLTDEQLSDVMAQEGQAMLSGPEIRRLILRGRDPEGLGLVVRPFDEARLNPNSLDLTLGEELLIYPMTSDQPFLDVRKAPLTRRLTIPPEGLILLPRVVYLGTTVEHTESHGHVPQLNGKSSLGRLGLLVHQTAGFGDDGFCGKWTIEMTVTHPLKIYPGMAICQVSWTRLEGERLPYRGRYQHQTDVQAYKLPVEESPRFKERTGLAGQIERDCQEGNL